MAALALTAACGQPPAPAAHSQAGDKPITIGRSYQLQSVILGDVREINIWTPADYDDGREIHGVLYVLDGGLDRNFQHIAGLGQLGALSWT